MVVALVRVVHFSAAFVIYKHMMGIVFESETIANNCIVQVFIKLSSLSPL